MPISSYVIRCAAVDQPALRRRLSALPGVEIGESTDLGMPVVTDAPTTRAAAELGERLRALPGVKSAVLVYHNIEDLAEEMASPAAPTRNP